MNQVVDFFRKLLDTSDFPPRWHCGKWTEFHGWFYIISDLLIWSAYFAIPVIILNYISRRKGIRFHKVYFLFAAFILACGLTHLLDALMFWYPAYRLSALVRFITAVASLLTVYHLFKILPVAFSLKSPMELEREVEQRRIAEEALIIKNRQLNEAQDIAKLGHWEWNIKTGKLDWSEGLYKIFGLDSSIPITYDAFLSKIHPSEKEYVNSLVMDAMQNKVFPDYYHRLILDNGAIKTIHAKGELILDDKGEVIKMLGTGQDVTDQKQSELDLITKTRKLEEANNELAKFAYVASHDLQEPLRKLITYTSLIDSDYKHLLDKRGAEFIDKISTSSMRMQKLISDILDLSRFSSEEITFESTDLNLVVKNVLSDLEITIEKSGAVINVGPLPVIEAKASQMLQLFQNLISNGIKFSKIDTPPVININSQIMVGSNLPQYYAERYNYEFSLIGNEKLLEQQKFCRITISDNGIGFNEQYGARIFEVFQRLHSKKEYEGTGIGLAICKKIVENHDGFITAKSVEGQGSEFIILLPVSQNNFKNKGIGGHVHF